MPIPTPSPTTAFGDRLVDLDVLVCPGCYEPVHDGPPTNDRGQEVGVGFCHRDGSDCAETPTGGWANRPR